MADEETARSRLFALPSVSPHKVSGAAPTDLGFEGLGSGLAVCGFGDSCSGSNSKTSVSFGVQSMLIKRRGSFTNISEPYSG